MGYCAGFAGGRGRGLVFDGEGYYHIVIDPEEIDEGRYWDIDEVMAHMGKGVFTPNFEDEFQRLLTILR